MAFGSRTVTLAKCLGASLQGSYLGPTAHWLAPQEGRFFLWSNMNKSDCVAENSSPPGAN